MGGDDGIVAQTTNYEYDPAKDKWSIKKNMPTARWGLVAATANNKIYAIGGMSGDNNAGLTTV